MNEKRRLLPLFFLFIALSIGIFHRSLYYSFHYDDYSKIVLNPATESLRSAAGAFADRNAQSTGPELNTHMYRPLFVVGIALERFFFGTHPHGYRFCNLLLHGLNAALVALLAALLFGLGWAGCVAAGLVFLLHPAQTESVVWIVEQSNLSAAASILLGLLLWTTRGTGLSPLRFMAIVAVFVAGLFVKESVAAFPFLLAMLAAAETQRRDDRRSNGTLLIALFLLMVAYLYVRHRILGQTSNIWMDQFTWRGYLAPITLGMGMALKFLLVPTGSTINHQPWLAPSSGALLFIVSVLLPAGAVAAAAWGSIKRRNKGALCFLLMAVLWIPTAQIIPIKSIFAERFLYFVLIPFSWLAGLAVDRFPSAGRIAAALYIVTLGLLTNANIPHWKDDGTLWNNALRLNPSYWNSWMQSAEWERADAEVRRYFKEPEPPGWRERAEKKYINGLKCGAPSSEAAVIFLRLAEINFQQGKRRKAEEHGQRAVTLRPEFKTVTENMRRKYVD